jgi:Tfp pilus assembly protein PilO
MAEPENNKKEEVKKKEEKKKKPPSAFWLRYYRSLVLFVFLVVAIAGWFVFVGPLFNSYRTIDVAVKKAEYDQYKKVLEKFQSILADWDAVSSQDKDRLNYFLPVGKDVPVLITMLEDMAQQSGFVVTIASLTQVEQPVIERTDVYPLIVSLSLEGGNYAGLKSFIEKVESSLRLIDIASVNFQSTAATYILNLKTYYINENNTKTIQ